MGTQRVVGTVVVGLLAGFTGAPVAQQMAHGSSAAHEFTPVNVEANGAKVWLPSVIVVP